MPMRGVASIQIESLLARRRGSRRSRREVSTRCVRLARQEWRPPGWPARRQRRRLGSLVESASGHAGRLPPCRFGLCTRLPLGEPSAAMSVGLADVHCDQPLGPGRRGSGRRRSMKACRLGPLSRSHQKGCRPWCYRSHRPSHRSGFGVTPLGEGDHSGAIGRFTEPARFPT